MKIFLIKNSQIHEIFFPLIETVKKTRVSKQLISEFQLKILYFLETIYQNELPFQLQIRHLLIHSILEGKEYMSKLFQDTSTFINFDQI